jgi:proteasome lid subunit RPN8/RPN11
MSKRSKDKLAKDAGDTPSNSSGTWSENKTKLRYKAFPGPADASEPLRVAMTREAYAELTAHAKESLNAEICGVLAGELRGDDRGPYVFVEAPVRGNAAKQGSTHVTFTQETWTQIHEQMEQKHPGHQIVGWYHSHPGFGVEFSEMDLFVQRNFFPGAGQIAYVTDPLGGEEAILVNTDGNVVPVSRFWVDGRERRCKTPPGAEGESSGGDQVPASVSKAISELDGRIGKLMEMIDAQANALTRFYLILGMIVVVGVGFFLAYQVYAAYSYQNRPPELMGFAPVPVQVGDKTVMLGVGVVKWEVPPSLNGALIQMEKDRLAAEEAARKNAAATQPATQAAPAQPTTAPAQKK